jgi:hypothetical protein
MGQWTANLDLSTMRLLWKRTWNASSQDTEHSIERRAAFYPKPPAAELSREERARRALAEKHTAEVGALGERHKAAGDKLRREQQNERARQYPNFHQRHLPQEATDKWAKARKVLEAKHDKESAEMERRHRGERAFLNKKLTGTKPAAAAELPARLTTGRYDDEA